MNANKTHIIDSLDNNKITSSYMPDWLKWLPLYIYLESQSKGKLHNEDEWQRVCQLAKECDQYYIDNPFMIDTKLVKNKSTPSNKISEENHMRSVYYPSCPPEWLDLERNNF